MSYLGGNPKKEFLSVYLWAGAPRALHQRRYFRLKWSSEVALAMTPWR
jgi:hypothetical protein